MSGVSNALSRDGVRGGLEATALAAIENIVSCAGHSGDPHRQNGISRYISSTPEIFSAIDGGHHVPPPMCVQIEVTNRCSTGCRTCGRFAWIFSKDYTPERELDTVRQVLLLQELARAGVKTVLFTGGEPMCHPELETLVETAEQAGLKVGILSNGIDITPSKADTIVRRSHFLRLSRDDAPAGQVQSSRILVEKNNRLPLETVKPQETFDECCHPKPGNYHDKFEDSIKNLKAAQQKHPNSKCRLGMAVTIQRANVGFVREIANYASDKQILAMFKMAHDAGSYLCSEESLAQFREEILNDPGIVGNPYVSIKYLRDEFFRQLPTEDIAAGLPTRTYYRINSIMCFTPYLYALIDAFGRVYVCSHLYDDNGAFKSEMRDRFCLGDIASTPFLDVWNSEAYQSMRARLNPINTCVTPCESCTRHWTPNTILTRLYRDVFQPLRDELGIESAVIAYKKLVERFAAEDNATWF